MTTRTKPFDPSAVKAGDEVIQSDYPNNKSRFVGLRKNGAVVIEEEETLQIVWRSPSLIRLIDTTPPRIVPHDMASFPRDGWYMIKNGVGQFTAIAIYGDVVRFDKVGNISYEALLNDFVQVHPDGTTSPCGREETPSPGEKGEK